MRPLIASLRPQEWVKNVLVFAGIVFSRSFDEPGAVADVLVTFVAFCAVSSAGYLFNDLRDVEHDRRHPDKRNRPIASGALRRGHGRRGRGRTCDLRDRRAAGPGLCRGRRDRRHLRRDDGPLLDHPQAPRDHRRDDDRGAVPPASGRGRGGGRRRHLGVPARLHGDAGALPRLHEAPPGGDPRGAAGRARRRR